MNFALNTLATRALGLHKGHLKLLDEIESSRYAAAEPATFFPRLGTVRLGGAVARQHTPQTCGTAVLALVNALFDEELMDYLQARGMSTMAVRERVKIARERFTLVQNGLLTKVTGRSWPTSLGTPPWGLARELRVPGVTYRHLPVDDRDPALMESLLPAIQRATESGIPVPLYVGGDLSTKVTSAAPRHVVLALPPAAIAPAATQPDVVRIYEPSSGRVFRRRWAQLPSRSRPDAAFGGWTHLAWVVLPGTTSA